MYFNNHGFGKMFPEIPITYEAQLFYIEIDTRNFEKDPFNKRNTLIFFVNNQVDKYRRIISYCYAYYISTTFCRPFFCSF